MARHIGRVSAFSDILIKLINSINTLNIAIQMSQLQSQQNKLTHGETVQKQPKVNSTKSIYEVLGIQKPQKKPRTARTEERASLQQKAVFEKQKVKQKQRHVSTPVRQENNYSSRGFRHR